MRKLRNPRAPEVRHTAGCRRARCAGSHRSAACRLDGAQRSAMSSGGSLPRGPARVCRCVHSSNGAHTARRWAKPEQPSWPPGPSQVEPPDWPASRRRSTQLTFRDTGPPASPALLLLCSSFIHLTNPRRACRHLVQGRAASGCRLQGGKGDAPLGALGQVGAHGGRAGRQRLDAGRSPVRRGGRLARKARNRGLGAEIDEPRLTCSCRSDGVLWLPRLDSNQQPSG
jgi:hypothetical protein